MNVIFKGQGNAADFARAQAIGVAAALRAKERMHDRYGELMEDDGIQMLVDPLAHASFRVLPPSRGRDENWHVTDEGDTMVAHCYGFGHQVKDGEQLARRISACLNFCKGMDTALLERLIATGH